MLSIYLENLWHTTDHQAIDHSSPTLKPEWDQVTWPAGSRTVLPLGESSVVLVLFSVLDFTRITEARSLPKSLLILQRKSKRRERMFRKDLESEHPTSPRPGRWPSLSPSLSAEVGKHKGWLSNPEDPQGGIQTKFLWKGNKSLQENKPQVRLKDAKY